MALPVAEQLLKKLPLKEAATHTAEAIHRNHKLLTALPDLHKIIVHVSKGQILAIAEQLHLELHEKVDPMLTKK